MGDYAIVAAGLVIGVMARWAVVLSLGQPLNLRVMTIDLLVLSMNGLLALLFGQELNLHHVRLAVEAAMLGASSTIVFAKMQGEWLKHNAGPITMYAGPHDTISVGPNTSTVDVPMVDEASPQSTPEVGVATIKLFKKPPDNPFADLIDKLDTFD
jgi:hypothetical protein